MGTDVAEEEDTWPYPSTFKVHHSMCSELRKLVDRIARIFPDIEAARPRCSSGIQALCSLNGAIDIAKQLLQYCCESSKLYMALTGETILLRCQRTKNLLEQSLCQIRTMVPVMLAAEISRIIDDLRATTFVLDLSEEEAGKALHALLRQDTSASDSLEIFEKKSLLLAAMRLHITSQKDILVEVRSIKKLLSKVGEKDHNKRVALNYFLQMLKKYGSLMIGEQTDERKGQDDGLAGVKNAGNNFQSNCSSGEESHLCGKQDEAHTGTSNGAVPEKFKCPISGRLMFDPVCISSGETFERMWIQKWFDEGNVTCPKTKMKLENFSWTSNKVMKDLISEWCLRNEVTITDPNIQDYDSLDISSTSIASLGNSMNNLHLQLDASVTSLGSSDYNSDSHTKVANKSTLESMCRGEGSDKFQSGTDLEILSRLPELPWESQCKVVEDVKSQLQYVDLLHPPLSLKIVIEPLIEFLRDAQDKQDLTAMKAGSELFILLIKNRNGMLYLPEDAFSLLLSLLEAEVIEEALTILDMLSSEPNYTSSFSDTGALISLLNILESENKKYQELVIKILHNISSNNEICSQIGSLSCIPKLVPLINDRSLARFCMALLRNLCDIEEARVSVAETNGCIASIAEVLECGNHEEQEHAVDVLLSLCCMREEYCLLVMDEMIIPSLVKISNNGSEKAKARALELLRQLREIDYDNGHASLTSELETVRETNHITEEVKPSSKTRRFFKKKLAFFRR